MAAMTTTRQSSRSLRKAKKYESLHQTLRSAIYGGWSNLWRVVEFRAGGRVSGQGSILGRAGHFGGNNVEQQLLPLIFTVGYREAFPKTIFLPKSETLGDECPVRAARSFKMYVL
jgi:hypothetical protein